MNKLYLKRIRDNIPETIKYLIAPLFRNKLIQNSKYTHFNQLLLRRELSNNETIKKYQFEELKKILIYAKDFVPYYTKLFEQVGFDPKEMKSAEEIKVIPYLTKEIIRAEFDQLISTKKISGGYYLATTGGSTGEPLKVLLDYDSVFKENAFVNYFRSKLGYQIQDRLATFRGVEFDDRLWKFNPMQNELIFSPFKLSKNTVKTYVAKINKYKPAFLNGYLSSLHFFAQLLSENNLRLKHPIKGIFLISENIDIAQREFLENFFNVKSCTFYGHTERCVIAEELSPNEYVFDPYYGYSELIDNSTGSFSIVSTGFLNKTMPLIRFKTNDNCVLTKRKTISISGRWDVNDFLIGKNEEKVFHSALNFHSEIFKNVTSYQFIQKQKGEADIHIIVNKDFQTSEIAIMKKMIDKKTKGVIEFNIKITDQLILSKRGKYKMFISELKDQKD